MGFWGSLFGTSDDAPRGFRSRDIRADYSFENPSTPLSNPDAWAYGAFGSVPSLSGPSVSEQSAMRQTAVYACVTLKAGLIGGLPMDIFQRTPKGRKLADQHRLYPLLHDTPNDLMSAFLWKELIGSALMLNGNHLSVIEYDGASRITGFIPVMWSQVRVRRVAGRNRYTIQYVDGSEDLDQEDVLHIPGLGFDGLTGLSPISWAARQPVGLALAMEESMSRLYANGMRPSAVYTLPKGINSDGQKRMIAEIESRHTGLANAGKPLFMDFGSDVKPGMMTPEDAQTIEQRRFQISDICRAFGVPPHMIGETDKTTSWGTGIEQQTLGFLKFNLDRDLCRIEGELNRKLFTGTPFYAEYDREALNALDAMTTAQLYSIGVQNARYTPNEVRRKSNLPDMPGGNQLFIQGATIPITSAGKTPAPANDPEPVKPEPDPEETK